MESAVMEKGRQRGETRYFITSLTREQADATQLLEWVRGHWSIENRCHWVRDMSFGEDASRIRTASGPEVMSCVRNAAIDLLRSLGERNIAAALRHNVACIEELFTKLGILKQ